MADLTLITLGALKASAKTESGVRELARGKPVALLSFLAASPGRRASRERLASLLWSDGSSEAARQNLRQTIWYIKRRLGDWLVASDDFLELVPSVDVDRDRFLIAVREQRLKDAIATYAGEFIPDFAAPGAADFEQWADIERRRLRGVFVSCCDTLARQALASGQFASAVELAKRARDAAPLDFATWRLLLESLTAARDVMACVAEAEHLEALAASDDLELDDATRAALRSARSVATGAAPAGAGASTGRSVPTGGAPDGASAESQIATSSTDAGNFAPELIGRESEFRALLARWEAAREGRGGAVLISGVAGLGKSRLLSDFHARLRASRARALLLRANPGDRAVGGGFVAALAESVAQRPGAVAISEESASVLVALAPALSSVFPRARPDLATGEDALRRRTNALLDLIRAVSDEAALALLVDDIHWSDAESRRVLDAVSARLEGGRVLLVLAARPPLETLGGFVTLPRFELSRFDLPRVAEFLTRLGELPSEPWAADLPSQLLAATRGIPLALVETLARLVEIGALVVSDQHWATVAPSRIAETLREGMVLEARVRSLTPSARELLLLLATFGRPTHVSLLGTERSDVVADAQASSNGALVELEHRGFVMRGDGAVRVAHDEISAAALASATDDERLAAHRRAAQLLADTAPESDHSLSLAAGHARSGQDGGLLTSLARRWVERQRRLGRAGSAAALLHELLGEDVPREERLRLARALPWWQRPARATIASAAASLALVLVLAGWVFTREVVPPELELVIRTDTARPTFYRIGLRSLEDWVAGDPIEAEEVSPHELPVDLTQHTRLRVSAEPYSDGWIGTATIADSGGDEVVAVDANGHISQPVFYRGDDASSSMSPDGRLVAFASARWHPETDRYNLAIWDRQAGTVRRLLVSDDVDGSPRWSPDGSRIAFVRRYFTEIKPATLCVTTVDGLTVRCDWPEASPPSEVVSWLDDDHVLYLTSGLREIQRLDIETGRVTSLGDGSLAQYLIDPRVVLARGSSSGSAHEGVSLRRTELAGARRPVLFRGREINGSLALVRARFRPRYVDRLRLVVPSAGLAVDLTHALRVEAFAADGSHHPARAVRFRSLDPEIAQVEAGRVIPRRLGEARIEVTNGGWRYDTATIRIVPSAMQAVVVETWDEGWERRWQSYGDPRPRVLSHRGRRTLNPNGDGRYPSGLYLQQDIPSATGVGVEMDVSLPLTLLQWQEVSVGIIAGTRRSIYGSWDHATAFAPGLLRSMCGTTLGAEGADNRMQVALVRNFDDPIYAPLPQPFYDGRWHLVRIQLFPDGRCGLAIDGRPVLINASPAPVDSTMVVTLMGHSYRTQLGFARVSVWKGVRGGVDWALIERP